MRDDEVFEIPRFTTQSGVTLDLKLSYKTFGKLSPAGDNVVVVPTFYGGRHTETEYMLAPGRAIDPNRHFVVIPNMFGNGNSSSPSNTPAPYGRGGFPLMSLYDNILCQHKLLTEHLGVKRIRLVAGFSMGGMGTWEVALDRPDLFAAIAPLGGRSGDPTRATRLKAIPAWVVNGTADTTTTSADAQRMVDALKAIGGDVTFTDIPEAGHVDTLRFYDGPELYEWFATHRRGGSQQR